MHLYNTTYTNEDDNRYHFNQRGMVFGCISNDKIPFKFGIFQFKTYITSLRKDANQLQCVVPFYCFNFHLKVKLTTLVLCSTTQNEQVSFSSALTFSSYAVSLLCTTSFSLSPFSSFFLFNFFIPLAETSALKLNWPENIHFIMYRNQFYSRICHISANVNTSRQFVSRLLYVFCYHFNRKQSQDKKCGS